MIHGASAVDNGRAFLGHQFGDARADAGQGMTLTVVTIVLLGGISIFGGRGTIAGIGRYFTQDCVTIQ